MKPMDSRTHFSVSNNTKWEELRAAMLELPAGHRPQFRSETLEGHQSEFDGEWFYHFREGGYADIRYFDLRSPNEECDDHVSAAIQRVGLHAERVAPLIWRVFGYKTIG
jgi:hypothetical protein